MTLSFPTSASGQVAAADASRWAAQIAGVEHAAAAHLWDALAAHLAEHGRSIAYALDGSVDEATAHTIANAVVLGLTTALGAIQAARLVELASR